MADAVPICRCRECRELERIHSLDGPQLLLIPTGGPVAGGPALPLLDATAAATAIVSDQLPHSRGRTLAAATTGVVR